MSVDFEEQRSLLGEATRAGCRVTRRLAMRNQRARVIGDRAHYATRYPTAGSDPARSIVRAKSFRLSDEIARDHCRRQRKKENKTKEEREDIGKGIGEQKREKKAAYFAVCTRREAGER